MKSTDAPIVPNFPNNLLLPIADPIIGTTLVGGWEAGRGEGWERRLQVPRLIFSVTSEYINNDSSMPRGLGVSFQPWKQ